jgi:hypothetical protein
MVQFRAIDRRSKDDHVKRFYEKAASLRRRVLEKIADAIVDGSPVDTGTYIMAHSVGVGRDSGFVGDRSSFKKRRNRNANQFRGLARGNLQRSVAALALGATDVYFRNRAEHAYRVEVRGWEDIRGPGPYHVYTLARAQAPQFIRDAAAELGFELR